MAADDSVTTGSVPALSLIWNRKAMIAAIVAGAVGLAAVALEVIEPRYTGEALIALNTRAGAAEPLITTKQSVLSPPLTTVMVATEIDILQSRALAGQVVDALALDGDPEFNLDLAPSILPEPLAALWNSLWMVLFDDIRKDAHALTVERVQKRLWAKSGADSYAIRVGFESESAKKAALIANTFADLYIRGQREAKLAEMHVATDWIARQIDELRSQVAHDTAETVTFRRRNNLAPVDTREQGGMAAQQMVAINTELAQVQRDRADAEAALAQARKALKVGGATMTALTFVEDSSYLQEVRKEEARLLGKIAEMSTGYRDNSPAISALKGQLATLRREIDREIAGEVEMLANKAAQAKAREDALKGRLEQINEGSSASDTAMSELETRQRVILAKNTLLDSFLARYAELTDRAEIEVSDARIASRAVAPAKASFPKPALFLAVAFCGSLGLSVSLAFLLERMKSGFRSTREIREALGLPTLGIIPAVSRSSTRLLPADYMVDKPESSYAEAVRSAQLALMNARRGTGKAVMITSSLPAEGKTAFAVSLGRCLALAEKRVLLVDADLRRPSVAIQLDSYRVPGFADYLREQASLDEIVRHDRRSGLDFVTSGGRTQDPQRLLHSDAAGAALAHWLETYEVVLIDTPPIMVAFDAALLAPYCDFAAYVVEWDKTPSRAVEAGIEHLRAFEIDVAGVVLSKVDLDRQRQYADYVDFCFRNSEYYGN